MKASNLSIEFTAVSPVATAIITEGKWENHVQEVELCPILQNWH